MEKYNYLLWLVDIACVLMLAGCVASEPVSSTAGDNYAPALPGHNSVSSSPIREPQSYGSAISNDGSWYLQSYGPLGAERGVAANTGISIRFNEDNRVSGSGGCNSYFAAYQTGPGNALTLGLIGSGRKMCPDSRSMESAYFNFLKRVSSYELSGNTLRLYYDDGQGVLNFIAQ